MHTLVLEMMKFGCKGLLRMPMWCLGSSKDKEGKQVSCPGTVVSDVMSFPLAMDNGLTGLMA